MSSACVRRKKVIVRTIGHYEVLRLSRSDPSNHTRVNSLVHHVSHTAPNNDKHKKMRSTC
ncbi:Hypothetical protein, putative [Bodo saltans]|uniref:Uncharacterized protein n=1 Tax=Bodo saltans TaxID=75058 RepID=A0A0S4KI18_BODSA|nr:Hypothetical protein, putative [Bodo saltans]|eukprot:CUI14236.1 Hypothetical protein, putative [Bodo saltans]